MSRRKGEITSAQVDRDWPYQVAISADVTVTRFHEIEAFTDTLSRSPKGHSVVHEGSHYNVYCFADEKDAELFLREYDGILFNPKDRGKGRLWMVWNRPAQISNDQGG